MLAEPFRTQIEERQPGWRRAIQTAVAMGIPVSLMGVLVILPWMNVELDSVTMSAMVLVIGIIVDDGIVVAENVWRCREQGMAPLDAAMGQREINDSQPDRSERERQNMDETTEREFGRDAQRGEDGGEQVGDRV